MKWLQLIVAILCYDEINVSDEYTNNGGDVILGKYGNNYKTHEF